MTAPAARPRSARRQSPRQPVLRAWAGAIARPAQEVPGECRAEYRGEGEAPPQPNPVVRTLVARPAGSGSRSTPAGWANFAKIDPARCTFDRVSLLMSALRGSPCPEAYTPLPGGPARGQVPVLPPPPPPVRPRHPDRRRAPFIMRASHGRTPSHEITSRASHRAGRLRVLRIEPPRPP